MYVGNYIEAGVRQNYRSDGRCCGQRRVGFTLPYIHTHIYTYIHTLLLRCLCISFLNLQLLGLRKIPGQVLRMTNLKKLKLDFNRNIKLTHFNQVQILAYQ